MKSWFHEIYFRWEWISRFSTLCPILYLEEHEHEHADYDEEEDKLDINELAEEADETLELYDENNDGKIHYGEFYRNHKKMLDNGEI